MKCELRSAFLALSVALAAGQKLDGAVIDAFGEVPQELAYGGGAWSGAAGPVDLGGGLFETRELSLSYGTQRLVVTGVDGALEYQLAEPLPGEPGNHNGYFGVSYASSTPVDLLGDGATAFRLVFESAEVGRSFPARFRVETQDGFDSYSWNSGLDDLLRDMSGPVAVDVPFAAFDELDLRQVVGIEFEGFRISPPGGFRMSSISTVPEPGPVMLLGIAWLVMGGRWRRRREHGRPAMPAG